jgi:succinyl-CoA synthetase beta subunit
LDLLEHQARDVFARYGVPVLDAIVATTPQEARAAAEKLGGVVVVKAQVKTGGRGKAGGVKLARDPEEAFALAKEILDLTIKGHPVRRVMVAAGAEIRAEYYVAILLDRANRSLLAIASSEGGVDIERLAIERPEALAKVPLNPLTGIDEAKASEIVAAAGFADDVAGQVEQVLLNLWEVYRGEDATLVEVNPLALTVTGVVALDAKVTLDDNAAFRHPDHGARGRHSDRSARAAGRRAPPQLRASSTARSGSSATVPDWS